MQALFAFFGMHPRQASVGPTDLSPLWELEAGSVPNGVWVELFVVLRTAVVRSILYASRQPEVPDAPQRWPTVAPWSGYF